MFKVFLPIILLAIIFVVITTVIRLLASGGKKTGTSFPYEKIAALFTPAERAFLGVLDQAIGNDFRIMGKVRLADVLKVQSGLSRGENQAAWNRIKSKHVDFVVCDPDDLSIQCVVELDDKSHQRPDRKQRDAFVDNALNAAGIPVFHVAAKQAYSIAEIRGTFFEGQDTEDVSEQ